MMHIAKYAVTVLCTSLQYKFNEKNPLTCTIYPYMFLFYVLQRTYIIFYSTRTCDYIVHLFNSVHSVEAVGSLHIDLLTKLIICLIRLFHSSNSIQVGIDFVIKFLYSSDHPGEKKHSYLYTCELGPVGSPLSAGRSLRGECD